MVNCHLICIHILQTHTHTHLYIHTACVSHLYFVTNWRLLRFMLFSPPLLNPFLDNAWQQPQQQLLQRQQLCVGGVLARALTLSKRAPQTQTQTQTCAAGGHLFFTLVSHTQTHMHTHSFKERKRLPVFLLEICNSTLWPT